MALELEIPEGQAGHVDENHGGLGRTPRILVLGVGGAGCNAINNMLRPDSPHDQTGLEFLVANCDAQSLEQSICEHKLQLGENTTGGLGAGSNPEMGKAAAQETGDIIRKYFEGVNMLFLTAGMGGGTGTGAIPVIAEIAKEMDILTVAVVTKPFEFEGVQRAKIADEGIKELESKVDSLIVVPNQNLFSVADETTSFSDAFRIADQVLAQGVWGITSLMTRPGLVNLDFNDIRTAMYGGGRAMLGTGEAVGENRAIEAARAAIANPLLETSTLDGARYVLINIVGSQLGLFEVQQAFMHIRDQVGEDAAINYGAAIDESLEGRMRVLVVATGVDVNKARKSTMRYVSPKPIASSIPPRPERQDDIAVAEDYATSEHYAPPAEPEPRPMVAEEPPVNPFMDSAPSQAPAQQLRNERAHNPFAQEQSFGHSSSAQAGGSSFVPERPVTNQHVQDSSVNLPPVDNEEPSSNKASRLFNLAVKSNHKKDDDDLPEWFRNND